MPARLLKSDVGGRFDEDDSLHGVAFLGCLEQVGLDSSDRIVSPPEGMVVPGYFFGFYYLVVGHGLAVGKDVLALLLGNGGQGPVSGGYRVLELDGDVAGAGLQHDGVEGFELGPGLGQGARQAATDHVVERHLLVRRVGTSEGEGHVIGGHGLGVTKHVLALHLARLGQVRGRGQGSSLARSGGRPGGQQRREQKAQHTKRGNEW